MVTHLQSSSDLHGNKKMMCGSCLRLAEAQLLPPWTSLQLAGSWLPPQMVRGEVCRPQEAPSSRRRGDGWNKKPNS